MDRWGGHAECCMSGGDKTYAHHILRNRVYGQSKGARAAPVLEAAGVLGTLGVHADAAEQGRERPADVLLCNAADIRVGTVGAPVGKVALDIGVVCPQAGVHIAAAQERLGAAEAYVVTKCGRANTEERCRQAGVVFQPMIFESLGGVSVEAKGVIKSLKRMFAVNQSTPYGDVATRFWQRLSIDIQRAGHRAFIRRVKGREEFGARGGMERLILGGALLELPEGQ